MSQIIAPNGSLKVTVPAGEKIAIATRGRANYALQSGQDKVLDSANPVATVSVENEEEVTAAVTLGGSAIINNMGPFECYVEVGVNPLSKDFRRDTGKCGPAIALNVSGTITTAMILSGSISSTSAAPVVATLETGIVSDLATEWDVGEGFDWGVINTGPSLLTVTAAATGHTLTGLGTVATTTAGMFRTVKIAADSFVTTRIG